MLNDTRLTGMPLEAWAGEVRVNLIRLLGLVLFYAHHLIQYHFLKDDAWRTADYHQSVTAVLMAWGGMIALIYLVLHRSPGPLGLKPWMKYAITAMDLLFIYLLVALHHEGARGPMALLLFLVIAAAPLRLSLRFVYFATLATMLTYLLFISTLYVKLGSERYYALDNVLRVPRPTQVVMLLTLGGAGLLAGQAVRQTRRLMTRSQA
jgi:hypothetical protein